MTSERNQQRVARLVAWADRHPVAGTALRIARELLAVDVRDRIFGMTGQAFLSLIPVTIIVSTFLSESDGESLANVVNARLGLTGSTADTVLLLFSKPEPSPTTAAASGLSLVLLFFSFNSYTRTIRRSMERPWGLPRMGWRGQLTGVLGVFLLMLMLSTLSVIATVWHADTRQALALEATVRTVVAGVFWLGIGRLLTHRRVPSRHLWPGAVVGGIGTSAIALWTVTVLPGIFERDAARYGVIGVALALVTWLLAVSGLAVVVGVVGGQIGRAAGWAGARPDPLVQPLLEQPDRPGQDPDRDP
jgi:membrane protein